MAIGLAIVLLLAAAGEARGGLYRVAQCGWGVGAELDPSYPVTEGTSFSLNTAACAPPPGLPGLAAGMRLEAGVAPDGTFGLARARWLAPTGTSFRAAHLTWSANLQWANWEAIGFDVGDQFQSLVRNTESKGPTVADLAIDGGAWAFEAWLRCIYSGSFIPCTRSVASTMQLSGLTFTLEDGQAPEVRFGGSAAAGGWQRGTVALELAATDVGAGIAGAEAWIDGSPVLGAKPECAKALIEGEVRGTKLQPCPTAATLSAQIDTTRLADGSHVLHACATDFSGGAGCAADAEVHVDNSPPAISFAGAAEGEVAATVSDRYSGPAAGTIAVRRGGDDAWTALPATLERESDGEATLTAQLPDMSAGVYLFRATATDAAGNSASAQLRVTGSPAELRRKAADGHDEKGANAAGDGPARRRRATRLEARLVAGGRPDARSLLVGARELPAEDSAMSIGLRPGTDDLTDPRSAGSRPKGSTLTIDYGTAAMVHGRLTAARGRGIEGRKVAIVVRPAAGVGAPERHRVLTDAGGRFALRLPPGASRHITIAFHGAGGLAPARPRSLTLRVRAAVTLAAEPTELHTGDSVHLTGRVRLGPDRLSGRGKLIAIQYLERATKRWRPALVVRTDAKGRFDTGYRFRYVTGVALIRLRATAPAEGGWPFARGSSSPVTVTVRAR
jgi:hypothetical protein